MVVGSRPGDGKDGSAIDERLTMGRDQGKAQSERPKRDPRRVMQAPKVVVNDPGASPHQIGQGDGSAPASKIAEAWGPTRAKCRGWSSYAFCSGSHHPARDSNYKMIG